MGATDGAGGGLPPVDLDAPEWVPIHGVTLDRYVELAAGVAGRDAAAGDDWLARHGVVRGTWPAIDGGWRHRIAHQPRVRARAEALRDGRSR